MNDVHKALSDLQKQAVRYLAERRKQNAVFERQHVIDEAGLTDDEYDRLIMFLDRQQAIEIRQFRGKPPLGHFSVGPGILDIVHELDHPPPKDCPKITETWLRRKWWSVPFLYSAALVACITAIWGLLRLVGILE